MEAALLQPDFSVSYVAHVGSRTAPTWVRMVSLWSSLEGSILFWGAMLGIYVLAAVRTLRQHAREEAWGLGVLLSCATFFALLIAGPANPFGVVSPVPADGPGPNPLLQNHLLMVVHPPLLYSGYVGMVVPFSLAIAALLAGRLGPAFLKSLRLWILIPWMFLSAGIVMGAWWAYEVLGWGGYWGWDPVENAPLLPWLTATAALHAVLVVERRELLRGWTVSLMVVTYLLTILGTFMTRSGVFNSVHAFAQSDIGPTFLVFLGICLIFSVVLLSLRLGTLGADASIDRAVSREGMVVVGNLVLILIMLTVLLGTVFPLITEAVRGTQISVGEPYFNGMTVPMAVALLFLMGVGPALPWGRVSQKEAWARLVLPFAGALIAMLIGLFLGARSAWLLAALFCGGFSMEVTLAAIFRPMAVRLQKGRGIAAALRAEFGGGRRRLGGYLAHAGIIVLLAGVAVSSTGKQQKEVSLSTGQSAQLGRYQLTFTGTETLRESNRESVVATVAVTRDGIPDGVLRPRMNYYFTQREPVGTPAVRSGLREDLYLSAMNIDPDTGRLGLRAFVNPMVIWIWIGTGIVLLGALLAAWPRRSAASVRATATAPAAAPAFRLVGGEG
jgi:cytochrome c-type biogenesis protein CcmF